MTDTTANQTSGATLESSCRAKDRLALEVSSKDRLTELDALRGLAALAVFWSHAFGMLAQTPPVLKYIQYTPLRLCYEGNIAVLLFFVLSGFVLNLKYVNPDNRRGNWATVFLIRRIFRIYPACIASFGLALLLRVVVFDSGLAANFSSWFQTLWEGPIDWGKTLYSATLIAPRVHPEQINSPLWSLVYEMRISLLFPLVIVFVNWNNKLRWHLSVLFITYFCCLFLSTSATMFYLPLFVLGAVCASGFEQIRQRLSSFKRLQVGLWLTGSLLLYSVDAVLGPLFVNATKIHYALCQISGLGSAGIILGVSCFANISTLLNRGSFQFLGRTSYSFYLVHLVIILAIAPRLYSKTGSFLICWLASLLISYTIAHIFFNWVEKPGMRLGSVAVRFLKLAKSKV